MINTKKFLSLIIFIFLFSINVNAQLEGVIVEKYYISDNNDATDSLGGVLEPGSITYRIYIDLKPGYRLKRVFGDAGHTLRISSSEIFFNNLDRGQSFGNNMSKSWLGEGTVALDSWLTLGQVTKTGVITNFGVLKNQDTNGSFIGGTNNDGGSSVVPGGLLLNNDPSISIPLTSADGFLPLDSIPENWGNYGILDQISNDDSTIFGSLKTDSVFISNNFGIQNSGVEGVDPLKNEILIAQLTTKGELVLEINIEVIDPSGNSIFYVANGSNSPSGDTLVSAVLRYPLSCGCTDPDYLEFNSAYSCNITDSCKTKIVFGCMDPNACNYEINANYNIQSLCCYPGYCNDRDLSLICPDLKGQRSSFSDFKLYPNPATRFISFQVLLAESKHVKIEIYNAVGSLVKQTELGMINGTVKQQFDLDDLSNGLYFFRLFIGEETTKQIFQKY